MSTTQRSVRLPVTTPATTATSPTLGGAAGRSDAGRPTSTISRRRLVGLTTAALLLGGAVGLTAPMVFSTTTAPAAVPAQVPDRLSQEHLNRIPLGPAGADARPDEHLNRIPLGPTTD
ncbi:hypothetical protein [Actinotalea sp. Marseille-Q4924]|uniref:hypothetical protein n=1 Tax=Actinotalea sp. Marseille-Q4924 TaxID=2866571 RepID=UPI001CE3C31F|nr:hypothetical protein [Actinotalea sp. Marseille-Q4924]